MTIKDAYRIINRDSYDYIVVLLNNVVKSGWTEKGLQQEIDHFSCEYIADGADHKRGLWLRLYTKDWLERCKKSKEA